MIDFKKIRNRMLGPPRDPFSKESRHNIRLIVFLAWVGLGADGLSSSCYGPQEAFIALGEHSSLAFYLAVATVVTVLIISLAYMQVIELFPSGGGGYYVATRLIGSYAGLISGSALIVDYVLTISISVASGLDALFSLLPDNLHGHKVLIAIVIILLMVYLNLRGLKESIKVLMPIFIGFVITHGFLIIYGVLVHAQKIPDIVPNATHETFKMGSTVGWMFFAALMLKAISLGGGTYTGLEAVSNNVGAIAEPRVRNSKLTMVCVALSLAFMAAGIITLYLIWSVNYDPHETLNATVFREIMKDWTLSGTHVGKYILPVVLAFETGLLFVAANTGFIAGPVVLSKMATDKWMPSSFSALSSRLVTKNGVLIMGAAAIAVIFATKGRVDTLVVLYSINVFITFALSFFGLSKHWITKKNIKRRFLKLSISIIALIVASSILVVTTIEKFMSGGWLTMLITSCVICIGLYIRKSYFKMTEKMDNMEHRIIEPRAHLENPPHLESAGSTAVFILDANIGTTYYAVNWVFRMFPDVYKNYVFLGVSEVDLDNFSEDELWQKQKRDIKHNLRALVNYAESLGIASTYYISYGTDVVEKVSEMTNKIEHDFPKSVFFGTKFILKNENFFTRMLYNQTSYIVQRRLHNTGHNMIIIPMNL